MDTGSCKLLVTNIPSDYKDLGTLFYRYGYPVFMYQHPPDGQFKWAFVTYASRKVAEIALRDLNHRPPLYLKVQFADTINNECESDDSNSYTSSHFNSGRYVGNTILQNGQKIHRYYKKIPDTESVNSMYNSEMGSFTSHHTGIRNDNFQHVGLSEQMFSEIQPYYTPKEEYEIRKKLEELYFTQDTESGNCLHCYKVTKYSCKECDGWYCSKTCQMKDWERHKFVCIPKLGSSETAGNQHAPSLDNVSLETECSSDCKKKGLAREGMSNEWKKPNSANIKYSNKRDTEKTGSERAPKPKRSVNERLIIRPRPTDDEASKDKSEVCTALKEDESFKMQRIPAVPNSENSMEKDVQMLELKQKFHHSKKNAPYTSVVSGLEKGTEGACQFREWLYENEFGVTILYPEVKDKFDKLFLTLLDVFRKERSDSEQYKPKIGETVAAFVQVGSSQSDETWMRARVLAVVNGNVHVNFCDMGKLATVKRVYKLPEELAFFPEFGARCSVIDRGEARFQQWLKEKRRFKFTVVSVDKSQNTALCSLYTDPGKYDAPEAKQIGRAVLKPWVPTFEVKTPDYVSTQLSKGMYQDCYSVKNKKPESVLEKNKDLRSVSEKDKPDSVSDKDKILELVSDKYMKAEYVSKKNKDLRSVSKKDMPESVSDKNKMLEFVPPENNELVSITAFDGTNSVYLQSVKRIKTAGWLKNKINLVCSLVESVDRMPEKDEIVACKLEHNQIRYFRAQVLEEVDNDNVKAFLIDYGNIKVVKKTSLKRLPSEFAKFPPLAVKVALKGVSSAPVNKDVRSLILNLIHHRVDMTVVIPGPLKDGVLLILPSGKNLNDDLNEYMRPDRGAPEVARPVTELEQSSTQSMQKADSVLTPNETKIFTEVDLKYLSLEVGKTVDLFVLHKLDSVSFMACDANDKTVTYVIDEMSASINKYCESVDEKFYVPRMTEVCFAKFEDTHWYRALCINDCSPEEDNILFIDFGNVARVDKSNIRKMTEEYMKIPAIAVLCSLDKSALSAEQRKQVDGLLETNQIYEAFVMSSDNHSYLVELPHVSKALSPV